MAEAPRAKFRLPEPQALARHRLLELAPELWRRRVVLVVAPAGCGKTTLLAQFAHAARAPAAYYWAEPEDADPGRFLAHLGAALADAVPRVDGDWTDPAGAALALEQGLRERTLLLVDDLHAVAGSAAESDLERLLHYAPPELAIVIASRSRPRLNWSRLLVADELLEIGGDDLRFRSWEVERLFRDLYDEPLPPEDLAELARRTEGWAAGLKLFHLATRGQPPSMRRRVLDSLGTRWTLGREYLARNVLDSLDDELRTFLLDTCVLTRLTGRLCDVLRGGDDAAARLRELEQRQIFTSEVGGGWYRYHEALRSQLEAMLVERVGEREARRRFRSAGELLEAEGAYGDALRAYCRGGAWDVVERLLGNGDQRIGNGRSDWLDVLPRSLVADDAWIALALARRESAAGRFDRALAAYAAATERFAGSAAGDECARERMALAEWLEPTRPLRGDALGLLRCATFGDPADARRNALRLGSAEGDAVAGLAALAAGDCAGAVPALRRALDALEPGSAFAAGAQVGLATALLLARDSTGAAAADAAADAAEYAAWAWLARIARASLALAPEPRDGALEASFARSASEHEGDVWGAALAALLGALGELRSGGAPETACEEAADAFRALGAGTLEVWARAGLALARARADAPEARQDALEAENLARLAGVPGAQVLAYRALARTSDAPGEFDALALSLAGELGFGAPAPADATAPPLTLRCFGGLRLELAGRPFDVTAVKPRARSLLRLLALHAGRLVHREALMVALWPDAGPEAAARNLHVLLSSLRHAHEPAAGRARSSLIAREGDAYRLVLPEGAVADLPEFDEALTAGRAARAAGDDDAALAAFSRALALHDGVLFPEEGPAEWVVHERDVRRAGACEAARATGELLLARGDVSGAAAACERGLALDRLDTALWELCLEAHEARGDTAAVARTRIRYRDALATMGVHVTV